MAEIESASCRYCLEEIKPNAKVCNHCSRSQHRVVNVLRASDVIASIIAFGVLVVTIWQLNQANEATAKAEEALKRVNVAELQANGAIGKAESALTKAAATETRVLEARGDVLEVAQTVTDIAEILSHSGEAYGGGLSKENQARLKQRLDILRSKLAKPGAR